LCKQLTSSADNTTHQPNMQAHQPVAWMPAACDLRANARSRERAGRQERVFERGETSQDLGIMRSMTQPAAARQFASAMRLFAIVVLFAGAAWSLIFAIASLASSQLAAGIVELLLAAAVAAIGSLRLRLWIDVHRSGR
jgi:hypothetical protein